MLSQIEKSKINPTVAIILKIADVLKIRILDLIEESTQKNILRLIHEDDGHHTFRKDDACEIRTLSPLILEKSIEFYRIKLKVNGELCSEAHFSGTEEFLYVARGKLLVTSGSESTPVSKGDSLQYRADVAHCLCNQGKSLAEAFLIVRYKDKPL